MINLSRCCGFSVREQKIGKVENITLLIYMSDKELKKTSERSKKFAVKDLPTIQLWSEITTFPSKSCRKKYSGSH